MEPVPGLDLARFAAWFERACPRAVTGPLRARLLADGRSNLTYEVSDGTRGWVVCRPPVRKAAWLMDTQGNKVAAGPTRRAQRRCEVR